MANYAAADASSQHVAVLTFPFASHPGVLLRLLRRIAAAVPDVTFSFISTAKFNKTLFASPCLDNVMSFDLHDGVPEGYVFTGKPMEDIELFLKVAAENCKEAVEKAEEVIGVPVSCVMADAFLWFTEAMAEEKGIPWVALWTAGACSLFTHFHTDLIRETVGVNNGVSGREDDKLCLVQGTPEIRLGDLQVGILFGNLASPFSVMLHKMGQVLTKAAAVQINSFEELEPEINIDLKSRLKNVLNICPFNASSPPPSSYNDDYGCIPWLNKQETGSVAYIGFGTVATPPPHELVALAEALEERGTRFLWSLKESVMPFLPPRFVERTGEKGKFVPWAPQVQVLGHSSVGVHITHCGWSAVLECTIAGVPIISRPFFGDQQINSWLVESCWKTGFRVRGGAFTKSGTIDALQEVLSGEKGKKLKERARYYKELALKSVEPNGSSSKNFDVLVEVVTRHNS